jgi:hypothetical protein
MMAFESTLHPLKFHLTVKNRVFRTNMSGLFDNREEARGPSRESMIAEIMSVFSPPPIV